MNVTYSYAAINADSLSMLRFASKEITFASPLLLFVFPIKKFSPTVYYVTTHG